MARRVKVRSGQSRIQLPNGFAYDAGQTAVLTDEQYRQIKGSLFGSVLDDLGANVGAGQDILEFPVNLAAITGAMDVITGLDLDLQGKITAVRFLVTERVTTAAKAATLNLEIGTTDLTGGVLALTSANCGTLGAVINGTAITGNNAFTTEDNISVEATGVTAFAEGRGLLLVTIQPTG
jgi:hypothetical protein